MGRYVKSFRSSGGTSFGFAGRSLDGGCHLTGSTESTLPVTAFTHPPFVRLQLKGSLYSPLASETSSETSSSAGQVSMDCQSGEPNFVLLMWGNATIPRQFRPSRPGERGLCAAYHWSGLLRRDGS